MSSNETKSTSCAASYICALCKGEFHKDDSRWSEEDANREFAQEYGRERRTDDVIVCDVCYKKIKLFHLINGAPDE